MLIERQLLRLVVELLEPAIEPVREAVVDRLDRLADLAAARGGAAAARLMRNGQRDPFVKRPRQQRGLAEPVAGVDRGAAFEVQFRYQMEERGDSRVQ